MKVKYLGQSCFWIEFGGKSLLFDPALSQNPLASAKWLDDLAPDYLLLTHGHGDHCADVESILKRTKAILISNWEIVTHYGKKGFKGHPMNPGGKWKFDFGTVKMVSASHSSSFPDGSYAGNPVGFVIWNEEQCFYFSGDTSVSMDMKLIPMLCPKLDLAILPIGDNFTMGIEEAILAAQFVECNTVLACHFDSFPYIEIDHTQAAQHFAKAEINLILPKLQEELEF